jgi:hypothetical protein
MNNEIINTKSTTLPSELIAASASEFNMYAKQTAIGILEMGRVVFTVKKEMKNEDMFKEFCQRIGYKHTSSSIKKLKLIGKKYDQLHSNVDFLPNSWTTLYEISRLAEAQLKEYIEMGIINPQVQGFKIKELGTKKTPEVEKQSSNTTKNAEDSTNSDTYAFECEIRAIEGQTSLLQIKEIIRKLELLNVKVKMNTTLSNKLYPVISMAA